MGDARWVVDLRLSFEQSGGQHGVKSTENGPTLEEPGTEDMARAMARAIARIRGADGRTGDNLRDCRLGHRPNLDGRGIGIWITNANTTGAAASGVYLPVMGGYGVQNAPPRGVFLGHSGGPISCRQ